MGLVSDWPGLIQDHRRKQSCRVLLIDETSIRKRHRYVTVILNGDTGEMLDMIEGRSKAAAARRQKHHQQTRRKPRHRHPRLENSPKRRLGAMMRPIE